MAKATSLDPHAQLSAIAEITNWHSFKLCANGSVQKKHYDGRCYNRLKWASAGIVPLFIHLVRVQRHNRNEIRDGVKSVEKAVTTLITKGKNLQQLKELTERVAVSLNALTKYINERRGIIGEAQPISYGALFPKPAQNTTAAPSSSQIVSLTQKSAAPPRLSRTTDALTTPRRHIEGAASSPSTSSPSSSATREEEGTAKTPTPDDDLAKERGDEQPA